MSYWCMVVLLKSEGEKITHRYRITRSYISALAFPSGVWAKSINVIGPLEAKLSIWSPRIDVSSLLSVRPYYTWNRVWLYLFGWTRRQKYQFLWGFFFCLFLYSIAFNFMLSGTWRSTGTQFSQSVEWKELVNQYSFNRLRFLCPLYFRL